MQPVLFSKTLKAKKKLQKARIEAAAGSSVQFSRFLHAFRVALIIEINPDTCFNSVGCLGLSILALRALRTLRLMETTVAVSRLGYSWRNS